jgi:cytochrome c1
MLLDKRIWRFVWIALLAALIIGCGGGEAAPARASDGGRVEPGALSSDELTDGVGPIRSLTLGELDEALAERGEAVFTLKCSACHKMDDRYVGPPLGDVLTRRTPAFVMNMMLNPAEMVERHPDVKALLAEYMTPMPNQNMTEDEARAVLEYLREQMEKN